MNRIQLKASQPGTGAAEGSDIEQALVTESPTCGVAHSLFAPLHYEPNYAYPLLVWLHGRGADERQLQRLMPLISMRNYVAVGPRGTQEGARDSSGFGWGDSCPSIEAAAQRVFACIEAAKQRFHIAPQRVFLAGYECGGTAAFRIGLQHPERFAGLLSVAGPFPHDRQPLASLRQIRRLPLFIAQGRDSQRYPVARTCEELRLFHAAGLCVTLRQYPCGDEIDSHMLHDINVWIMEQVTGVGTSSEKPPPALIDDN